MSGSRRSNGLVGKSARPSYGISGDAPIWYRIVWCASSCVPCAKKMPVAAANDRPVVHRVGRAKPRRDVVLVVLDGARQERRKVQFLADVVLEVVADPEVQRERDMTFQSSWSQNPTVSCGMVR